MELLHYGIKGMKWGVRRFQNKDGTRTAAGKKRYNSSSIKSSIKEVVSHPVLRNTLAYQGYIQAVDDYVDSYSKTRYGQTKSNKRYVEQGAAFAKLYAMKKYLEFMKEYE